jgi:catechol 2,3-dioxygenase-like lactoylglutathione lyase family enzyme
MQNKRDVRYPYMTEEARQAVPRPVLTSISAQLFVADIQASCVFYTDKLGFTVDFVYGDPLFYAQVSRDNAKLSLRHMDEPVFAGDVREREGLLSASITLADVDETKQLFLSYQSLNVPFPQTLKQEPWGATTFIVADPDGNLILFAGPPE